MPYLDTSANHIYALSVVNFIIAVSLEIPNWSPEMHVNWSLCMKLYISAPEDMEQAAKIFIEVCTSSI